MLPAAVGSPHWPSGVSQHAPSLESLGLPSPFDRPGSLFSRAGCADVAVVWIYVPLLFLFTNFHASARVGRRGYCGADVPSWCEASEGEKALWKDKPWL